MALQALESQLREMVQCKICFEDKDVQKQLPCQHTLCLECLTKLKLDDSKYKCPLCQRECYVPNGGLETLPDSLITKQLASIMHAADMTNAAASPASSTAAKPADSNVHEEEKVSQENQLARKCQPILVKGEELLETANERKAAYGEAERKWEETELEVKEKIQNMLEEKITTLKARAKNKMKAVEEIVKLKKAEISEKLEKLNLASSSTQESVDKIKSLQSAEDPPEDVDEDLKELIETLQTLRDETLSGSPASGSNGKFVAGDSVRLRVDVDLLKPSFLERDLTHLSVGYIHEINAKGDCAVIFLGKSSWVGNTSTLDKSNVKHDLPVVGDRVRVKDSVSEPHFKWGKSKRGDIGVLLELKNRGPNAGREVSVNFPDDHDWKGIFDELERVPPESLKVGDEVWIARNVNEPIRGWAGVTSTSIGSLQSVIGEEVVVDFPECKEWKGLVTEIEKVRSIMVGDKVRVMKSVKEPKTGWAGVDHEHEGVVKVIKDHQEYGKVAGIDFPNRVGLWNCLVSELEIVHRHSGAGSSSGQRRRIEVNGQELMQAMQEHNKRLTDAIGRQQCETQ